MKIRKGTVSQPGVVKMGSGYHFSIDLSCSSCRLLVADAANGEEIACIFLDTSFRTGSVFRVLVSPLPGEFFYAYELPDGSRLVDPMAPAVVGNRRYGQREPIRWGHFLKIPKPVPLAAPVPASEWLLYRLHVRGFTKQESALKEAAGTYSGIQKKIPYLRRLGVTAVELMPAYEFEEGFRCRDTGAVQPLPPGKVNYWGYDCPAFYCAPKNSYAASDNAVSEFSALISAFHRAGIAVVLEMSFSLWIRPYAADVLRFLRTKYGIDGFHLYSGQVNLPELRRDPLLSDVTLLGDCLDGVPTGFISTGEFAANMAGEDRIRSDSGGSDGTFASRYGGRNSFSDSRGVGGYFYDPRGVGSCSYNLRGVGSRSYDLYGAGSKGADPLSLSTVYCNDYAPRQMRTYLFSKGELQDGEDPASFWLASQVPFARVNSLADQNGFTLMDVFSYSERHNEANLEHNRDGNPDPLSDNCGAEGPANGRKIQRERLERRKVMLMMALFAPGIPRLQAGDEWGHTQKGNNNPYCQDNEITWLNWRDQKKDRAWNRFVRDAIGFWKAHPVFRWQMPFSGKDPKGYGCPDFSVHGLEPWCPLPGRIFAILYYRRYTGGETLYLTFNMTQESQIFYPPTLPEAGTWQTALSTWRKEERMEEGEGQKRERMEEGEGQKRERMEEGEGQKRERMEEDKSRQREQLTVPPKSIGIHVWREKGP